MKSPCHSPDDFAIAWYKYIDIPFCVCARACVSGDEDIARSLVRSPVRPHTPPNLIKSNGRECIAITKLLSVTSVSNDGTLFDEQLTHRTAVTHTTTKKNAQQSSSNLFNNIPFVRLIRLTFLAVCVSARAPIRSYSFTFTLIARPFKLYNSRRIYIVM